MTAHIELAEIERHRLARRLRQNAMARRTLERGPMPFLSMGISLAPLLVQLIAPEQLARSTGLPPSAAWLAVVTMSLVLGLAVEVTLLRRQIQALRQLCCCDEGVSSSVLGR